MNPGSEDKPALPLEELAITPQWVKAPAKSYEHHPGGDREEHGRGRNDGDRRPRDARRSGERGLHDRRDGPKPVAPANRPPQREGQRSALPGDRGQRNRTPRGMRQGPPRPQPPRVSVAPVEVSFVPEENGFASMIGAMKKSPRAYALFDLARLILNKPERHIVKLVRTPAADGTRAPLHVVMPSENPFLTQEDAVRFLFRRHANLVYKEHKKPIDPPKGNFAFVNRCGMTGVLLGPPNYHEYQTRLVRHHQQRLAHVPFEQFKARIQTVKDPEAVKSWVESMSFKFECEYLLEPAQPAVVEAAVPGGTATPGTAVPVPPASGTDAATTLPEPAAAVASLPAPKTGKVFSSREEAEKYFLENHLAKLVTAGPEVKISGHCSREIEHSGLLETIRMAWESERKFPLKTANELRARLRREGFHFFKHTKGITYISIVKPKRFESLIGLTDQAQKIVAFLRANAGCNRKQLMVKLLTPPVVEAAVPGGTGEIVAAPAASNASGTDAATIPPPPSQESCLADLRWLIMEGYVVEFSDGHLWALEDKPPQPPPTPKKPIEPAAVTSVPGGGSSSSAPEPGAATTTASQPAVTEAESNAPTPAEPFTAAEI